MIIQVYKSKDIDDLHFHNTEQHVHDNSVNVQLE